jgi:hypothetical protein
MNVRRCLAAGVAALFASTGVVALSGSPAQAISDCQTYTDFRWDATACIDHTGTNARAGGQITVPASGCDNFRVYLVAVGTAGDEVLKSTSAHRCDAGYQFTEMTVSIPTKTKSRIIAWDSRGNRVLSLETLPYNGT